MKVSVTLMNIICRVFQVFNATYNNFSTISPQQIKDSTSGAEKIPN
jgi:hypothetical protein